MKRKIVETSKDYEKHFRETWELAKEVKNDPCWLAAYEYAATTKLYSDEINAIGPFLVRKDSKDMFIEELINRVKKILKRNPDHSYFCNSEGGLECGYFYDKKVKIQGSPVGVALLNMGVPQAKIKYADDCELDMESTLKYFGIEAMPIEISWLECIFQQISGGVIFSQCLQVANVNHPLKTVAISPDDDLGLHILRLLYFHLNKISKSDKRKLVKKINKIVGIKELND